MGQPILSHLTYIITVPVITGEIGIQRILEKLMATIFPKFTKAKLRDISSIVGIMYLLMVIGRFKNSHSYNFLSALCCHKT